MKTKRIVISGGPGSGKTTLINYLEKAGYPCLHEISRDVIIEAQKAGIEQLFLTNPMLFSEKLLEGRLKQFKEASDCDSPFIFFDRGLPDVTAYMDYIDSHYPENFSATCNKNRYDMVFLLPPWKAIYLQDNERYESYEQAERVYQFLVDGYKKYDYKVVEVPTGTIEDRTSYMLEHLKPFL